MRKATSFWLSSAAVLFLLILVENSVHAATFTVNNNGDAGDIAIGDGICSASAVTTVCTLRAAVEESNFNTAADIIIFAAALNNQSINLVNGELSVTTDITITGPGARLLTVLRSNVSRHIFNDANSTLNISGVTFTQVTPFHGDGVGNGGSIRNVGVLNLTGVTIRNNTTDGNGGGIANEMNGSMTIRDSTINGNTANVAPSSGGGIYLDSPNTTNIYNSTISGNSTNQYGGGIVKINSGALNLINVTITNNTATSADGGGLVIDGGVANVGNTIIAANFDTVAGDTPDVFGTCLSLGNSLIGDGSGSSGFTHGVNGDRVGGGANPVINAQISPLTFSANSPTQTHVLLPGSQAVDNGRDSLAQGINLTLDQRGLARFIDGFAGLGNDAPGTVDIGAVEAQTTTAASVPIGGRVTNASGRGIYGARIFLTTPSGEVRFVMTNPFGYYRFDEIPVGATYIFDVQHKRYTFAPQALTITEERDDLNFTASP